MINIGIDNQIIIFISQTGKINEKNNFFSLQILFSSRLSRTADVLKGFIHTGTLPMIFLSYFCCISVFGLIFIPKSSKKS